MKLIANSAQIVTVNTNGKNVMRGADLKHIGVLTEHAIIIEDDRIKDIIPNNSIKNPSKYDIIDAQDKIVLPGLVECHTHSAFAGSRADEFKLKLQGKTYEQIARRGGGILSTVNAVRNSSPKDLIRLLVPRIQYFISQGITTLEIKSGYGLDFENELKMLEVIHKMKSFFSIDIISTFLGAHTYPPEFKDNHKGYIDLINKKILPIVAEKKLAKFCDAYCELSAFSAAEVDVVFKRAKELGFQLRLHSEQFHNIGGLELALSHDAVSVDHLEVMYDKHIFKLAAFDIVAVLLPGVSFFLNYDYAPARKLIDNNAIVALSTDYNPGSSHIANLNLIMSLAAIRMEMTFEEVIAAVTINAAKAVLKNREIGSIEIGKKADFAIFDVLDYAEIIYNVGKNLNVMTIKNGKVIFPAPPK